MLAEKDPPGRAILDWMMPGIDGLEICRRSRAGNRRLYVIIVTARDNSENIAEGRDA